MAATNNPWGKITTVTETMNFAEIMSEEYAHHLHSQDIKKMSARKNKETATTPPTKVTGIWGTPVEDASDTVLYSEVAACSTAVDVPVVTLDEHGWEDCSALLLEDKKFMDKIPAAVLEALDGVDCDSDAVIAAMLQSQFDHEYNEELRRIEQKRNKSSKVSVTLDKFHRNGDLEFLNGLDKPNEVDEEGDWDRFETNEKVFDGIPKCGFKMDDVGEMITKHDEKICGVRNACRVMSFPPEIQTGDAESFDMRLSNQVYNQLKIHSRRTVKHKSKEDRKVQITTAEMSIDESTRLLLYKLINNQVLEQINGVVSTGKEAIILHADTDTSYDGPDRPGIFPGRIVPKECAIKIFKTTLNQFKQRDRYIKDDYRFKERFSKQNNRVIISMWAEKEMHNLMRMRSVGISCPDVVVLKKHVLVMSFIGDNHRAAPKLKDAHLTDVELSLAYEEIVATMHKLYNEAKLVHADLSEYNILWWKNQCWFIDVAQSIEPDHPSALEFLMRDCNNIVTYFTKCGLPNIYTKEELFEFITSLNAETHNAAMLERIHTRGASIKEATLPDFNQKLCPDELKPIEYPFELAWEKSQAERQEKGNMPLKVDQAANAMQVLSIKADIIEDKVASKRGKKSEKMSKKTVKTTANAH